MKKIKLIVKLLPLFILFFLLTKSSFAITPPPIILFDFSKEILQQKIQATAKDIQLIKLPPFTTISIKPGTFDQDTIIFVYRGDFDKIKAALPKDQSPISSYYLKMFSTKTGMATKPLMPINIQSVNNYSNTNTFYYPIDYTESIYPTNIKNWNGNILVNTDLPINDSAFIVAADKNLDKNDPALNVAKPSQTPQATPFLQNKTKQNNQNGLLLTVGALIAVVGIICVVFWVLWKKQKKII
jgi:hypothetical protein